MNKLLLLAVAAFAVIAVSSAAEFHLQQELNERIDEFVEMAIEEEMERELDALERGYGRGKGECMTVVN